MQIYGSPELLARMKIVRALDVLSKSGVRSLREISVSSLCEAGGVARSTFYNYFNTKNDVVNWLSQLLCKAGMDKIGRTTTWQQGYHTSFTLFDRYASIFRIAQGITDYDGFVPSYIRYRVGVLEKTLSAFHHLELTPLLRIQMRAAAVLETEVDYLHRDEIFTEELSVREYAELMTSTIPRELYQALKNPVNSIDDDDELFLMLMDS